MAQPVLVLPPPSHAWEGPSNFRVWLLGLTRRDRWQSRPRPDGQVSDAQIASLVCAARRLARQQRALYAAVPKGPEAHERLIRQDWAVRAGEAELAARAAARARALPEWPGALGAAPAGQVGL